VALTKEAGERIVHARWVAGAVFDLVSDLVTMNGMEPMAALESIHQTELYARLWYDDVWTYPHWAIYEEFCREEGIEARSPLRQWDYPEMDTMEFVCEVFETYRFLASKLVFGHVLGNVFEEQGVYRNLLKDYERIKDRSPVDLAIDIEKGLKKRKDLPKALELIPAYEETTMERFFNAAHQSEKG